MSLMRICCLWFLKQMTLNWYLRIWNQKPSAKLSESLTDTKIHQQIQLIPRRYIPGFQNIKSSSYSPITAIQFIVQLLINLYKFLEISSVWQNTIAINDAYNWNNHPFIMILYNPPLSIIRRDVCRKIDSCLKSSAIFRRFWCFGYHDDLYDDIYHLQKRFYDVSSSYEERLQISLIPDSCSFYETFNFVNLCAIVVCEFVYTNIACLLQLQIYK